jgi:adenylosuccinate synthase
MHNYVVIGANYGDEGKGRMTDSLSNMMNSMVIRFSGSNNAGHTVERHGIRHVFHLLGSGTLNGSDTYLSKHVSIDPAALLGEYEQVNEYGFTPTIFIDPRCKIVLPYDAFLNRIKENSRNVRHGSTGNGLNESITRNEYIPLTVNHLLKGNFRSIIEECHDYFVDQIKMYDFKDKRQLIADNMIDDIFNKLNEFITHPNLLFTVPNLSKCKCVFEGSQGLLLDEYNGNFPHVTRARTGAHNVIDICREQNITIDSVYYMSRPYLSRHGNDINFIHDENIEKEFKIIDETNIFNTWQENLKFAKLDCEDLNWRISQDFELFSKAFPGVDASICMTCVDQYKGDYHQLLDNFSQYFDYDLCYFKEKNSANITWFKILDN